MPGAGGDPRRAATPLPHPLGGGAVMSAAEFYDAIAARYDEANGNLWPAENAVIALLLARARCTRGRVLDLGCGTGLYLELMRKGPQNYVGIDISPAMVAQARRKFPRHTFHVQAIEELTAVAAFDTAVSLFGSFSYVLDVGLGLNKIWQSLKPGGRMFLMLLGQHYWRRPSYLANRVGVAIPAVFYSPRAAAAAARAAGFVDVRVSGMTSLLVEPWLQWLPTGSLARYLWWEARVIGRRWPGLCYHCVVTATKP